MFLSSFFKKASLVLMMEFYLGFVVVLFLLLYFILFFFLFLLFLYSSKAVASGKETAMAGSSVPLRWTRSASCCPSQPHTSSRYLHGVYLSGSHRAEKKVSLAVLWRADVLGSLDNENASGAGLASSQQCAAPVFVLLVGEWKDICVEQSVTPAVWPSSGPRKLHLVLSFCQSTSV